MTVFNPRAQTEGDAIPDAIAAFIARWSGSEQAERGNAQSFLSESCEALGLERPEPARGGGRYRFERTVTHTGPDGRDTPRYIDLYRHGCFILEAKQGSEPPGPGRAVRRERGGAAAGGAQLARLGAPHAARAGRQRNTWATCHPTSLRRRS